MVLLSSFGAPDIVGEEEEEEVSIDEGTEEVEDDDDVLVVNFLALKKLNNCIMTKTLKTIVT